MIVMRFRFGLVWVALLVVLCFLDVILPIYGEPSILAPGKSWEETHYYDNHVVEHGKTTVLGIKKWNKEDAWFIEHTWNAYRDDKLYFTGKRTIVLGMDLKLRFYQLDAPVETLNVKRETCKWDDWNDDGYTFYFNIDSFDYPKWLECEKPVYLYDRNSPWTIEILLKSGALSVDKTCDVMLIDTPVRMHLGQGKLMKISLRAIQKIDYPKVLNTEIKGIPYVVWGLGDQVFVDEENRVVCAKICDKKSIVLMNRMILPVYRVKNLKQFLKAIGYNRIIEFEPNTYDWDKLPVQKDHPFVRWQTLTGLKQPVIYNVIGLTIRGSGNQPVKFTNGSGLEVLSFYDSSDIMISNIEVFAHVSPENKEAGLVTFRYCKNVTVKKTLLQNSVQGFMVTDVEGFKARDCVIKG